MYSSHSCYIYKSLCDSSSDEDEDSNPSQQDVDEVADLQESITDTEGTNEQLYYIVCVNVVYKISLYRRNSK